MNNRIWISVKRILRHILPYIISIIFVTVTSLKIGPASPRITIAIVLILGAIIHLIPSIIGNFIDVINTFRVEGRNTLRYEEESDPKGIESSFKDGLPDYILTDLSVMALGFIILGIR